MADVFLTRGNCVSEEVIRETVWKALESLKFEPKAPCDSVIIKPNLCYYWDYTTGQTTDPRVVSCVVDWVREITGKKTKIFVCEADASAMKTKYAFTMLGYEKLARVKELKLINLSEGDIVEKTVTVNGRERVLPVNKMLLDADLIINIPKLKTHRMVGFTCALKNMFGAIAKIHKYSYHKNLAETIVGINKIVSSDIVLVDGVIVGTKKPKKMGVILTGEDILSVDLVSADLLGYSESSISYLSLAKKERIGDASERNVICNYGNINNVKKDIDNKNSPIEKIMWNIELKMLRTYARIVGDIIPPILDLD